MPWHNNKPKVIFFLCGGGGGGPCVAGHECLLSFCPLHPVFPEQN